MEWGVELRQAQVLVLCPRTSLGGAAPLRLECKARLIWSMQATVFSKSNIGRGLESGRLLRGVGFDGSPGELAKAQRDRHRGKALEPA